MGQRTTADAMTAKGTKAPRPKRSRTSPAALEVKAKETEALKKRLSGWTFQEIADELGWANKGTAHRAVERALAATQQEPADALRKQMRERLNQLLKAMMPKAIAGDHWAVDRVMVIEERLAKLEGLDKPVKQTVEVNRQTTLTIDARRPEQRAQLHDLLRSRPAIGAGPAAGAVFDVEGTAVEVPA